MTAPLGVQRDLGPSPNVAYAAFGTVWPADSTFTVDVAPNVARPVGNTRTNPAPDASVIVTFAATAAASAGMPNRAPAYTTNSPAAAIGPSRLVSPHHACRPNGPA